MLYLVVSVFTLQQGIFCVFSRSQSLLSSWLSSTMEATLWLLIRWVAAPWYLFSYTCSRSANVLRYFIYHSPQVVCFLFWRHGNESMLSSLCRALHQCTRASCKELELLRRFLSIWIGNPSTPLMAQRLRRHAPVWLNLKTSCLPTRHALKLIFSRFVLRDPEHLKKLFTSGLFDSCW